MILAKCVGLCGEHTDLIICPNIIADLSHLLKSRMDNIEQVLYFFFEERRCRMFILGGSQCGVIQIASLQ